MPGGGTAGLESGGKERPQGPAYALCATAGALSYSNGEKRLLDWSRYDD